nr:BREX-6 system adenine-specific DNA-methyltransferase PglX [Nannocystis sp.]
MAWLPRLSPRAARGGPSVAVQAAPNVDKTRDALKPARCNAALLIQNQVHPFCPGQFERIPEWPLVYWWPLSLIQSFRLLSKVGDTSPAKFGLTTGNNLRFTRMIWEVIPDKLRSRWAPFIFGAEGRRWVDEAVQVLQWERHGLAVKLKAEFQYGSYSKQIRNEDTYFRRGVAFSAIGHEFCARAHRELGIISNVASSVFPENIADLACLMNTSKARSILSDLNPGMHFEVGDVNRLPLFPIASANEIFATVEHAFTERESHREPSVEFRRPGASPWRHVQDWAQVAVDRPEGAPLPAYEPEHDPEPATDHLSNALGVALGRFGPAGEGILDPTKDSPAHALPAGVLFLDGTLDAEDLRDSLGHAAARPLHHAFEMYGAAAAPNTRLRAYLIKNFFELHRKMYENRPIHWPLSSSDRTFVAWVTIHRWDADTLRVLLADHLHPTLTRIDGALADLRAARDGTDKKAGRAAEKRVSTFQKARDELAQFIATIEQCAEKGPPPPDAKKPEREVDARYVPDLDDGVMVNAAALWPLLAPQWKDPKKWWKELATADGKKDYDWSHLAMRYWPRRVDAKCQQDPSLAVAHGCFYKYHPARAWAWELRLQDEIGPAFRIEEAPYRGDGGHEAHRTVFLADHTVDALAAVEKEALRRIRKHKRRLGELVMLEAGLWGERPELCWALELRVLEKQEQDFYLRAPDEPAARAAFVQQHPELVKKRRNLLESLRPSDLLIGGDEEEGAGADDDAGGEDDEA